MSQGVLRRLIVAALLIIVGLCAIVGGPANPIDVNLVKAGITARHASAAATEGGIILNDAGGPTAVLLYGAAGTLWLFIRRRPRTAIWLIVVMLGGRLIAETLKDLVHRARPAFDVHPVMTHSYSFPSGHAANSMIVLPALALFLARPGRRTAPLTAAVFASLIIGISRPLLGVHWPTDVIAGWALGAAWLIAIWPLADRIISSEGSPSPQT